MRHLIRVTIVTCVVGLAKLASAQDCTVAAGNALTDMVSTTSGSGAVVSAHALFVCPGDAGKSIVIGNAGSVITATTTISVCTDSSHITTTANASSTTANSTAVWQTGTPSTITSNITTQVTACKSANASQFPSGVQILGGRGAGRVILNGGYLINGCIYDVTNTGGPIPQLVGSGSPGTIIFISPDTWTNCGSGPFLLHASGSGFRMTGLSVAGGSRLFSGAQNLVDLNNVSAPRISDVQIWTVGIDTLGNGILAISNGVDAFIEQTIIHDGPTGDKSYACVLGTSGTSLDLTCSNHFRSLFSVGGFSRTPATSQFTLRDGVMDECGDPSQWCTVINDNGMLQTDGTTFFSTIHVGTNATLYMQNGNVGAFNSTTTMVALDVNAGGVVKSIGTTWRGNAGARSVVNRGTFVDMLGNEFPSCTSGVCTARKASAAFTGNQPVRQ